MRLATVVVAASLLLVTAVYGALRLTHTLPSERQAQATLAAARRVIDGRAFADDVIQPLEQYLADALPIARNIGPFANFIDHALDDRLPFNSMLPASRAPASPLIERWRVVMSGLETRDIRIYGLPHALLRGDTTLREFVAARLAHADPALARVTANSAAVELAVGATVGRLGVSRMELNGIMFAAERAHRLRSPATR